MQRARAVNVGLPAWALVAVVEVVEVVEAGGGSHHEARRNNDI
jgi:hypothetical protein